VTTQSKFVIKIPDPSMRQNILDSPNFIHSIPFDNLQDVTVRIDLEKIQPHDLIKWVPVYRFLQTLLFQAVARGLKMVVEPSDHGSELVYSFVSGGTV